MRLKVGISALIALAVVGLSACGGKDPLPPPPVVDETVAATPDADSLAAAERARMTLHITSSSGEVPNTFCSDRTLLPSQAPCCIWDLRVTSGC